MRWRWIMGWIGFGLAFSPLLAEILGLNGHIWTSCAPLKWQIGAGGLMLGAVLCQSGWEKMRLGWLEKEKSPGMSRDFFFGLMRLALGLAVLPMGVLVICAPAAAGG